MCEGKQLRFFVASCVLEMGVDEEKTQKENTLPRKLHKRDIP